MYTLILNGTNVVSGTSNSTYKYSFPGGSVQFQDKQVAVSAVQMYYSWFNLTAAQSNTTFAYVWPLPTPVTVVVTVPDGFYSVSSLNSYLQTIMVTNGHYLTDSSGNTIFYLQIVTNAVYYAVSLNSYAIPTSAAATAAGYTGPSNWPGYATGTSTVPQFVVATNNFQNIVGLSAGTYPSSSSAGTTSTLSTFCPQVSPVQSCLVGVSLCRNPLSNPSNIIYSFSPANTSFGSLISSQPYALNWVDVTDGYKTDFSVTFTDQNFNPLVINDTNLVIVLVVKDKSE